MSQVHVESRDELLAVLLKLDSTVLVEKLVDALLELQQLREENQRLRQRVGSHSGNTSMPPSSDGPKTKAEQKKARAEARKRRKKGEAKSQGGQRGHEGHFRERVEKPDHTEVHVPPACPNCSHPIDGACIYPGIEPIWHQIFELVRKPVEVTEHRSPACLCPHCGKVFQLPLPKWLTRAGYGPRLGALGLFLRAVAQSSTRDVVEFFKTVRDSGCQRAEVA
jgi:transposase